MKEIHGINLLESLTAGLDEEEEHDEKCGQIAACKNIAIGKLDIVGDERSEESQHEVPEPVGGCAEGHGDGTIAVGEHLADACPY